MRIELHYDLDAKGNRIAAHVLHTEAAPWNTCADPTAGNAQIPMLQWLNKVHRGQIPLAGTGWDVITTHPNYPGKNLLEVARAELVRLNDVAARALLGV